MVLGKSFCNCHFAIELAVLFALYSSLPGEESDGVNLLHFVSDPFLPFNQKVCQGGEADQSTSILLITASPGPRAAPPRLFSDK